MRIGLIGTGSFARRGPLPAIASLPEMELAAVYGRNSESVAEVAEHWNAGTVCDSLDALLARREIDAVMVVTPPASHLAIAGAVLDAGKPLICEKPVTLSSCDAGRLDAKAKARGIPNAVDHEYRYDPAIVAMAELLRAGEIGTVRSSSLSAVTCFANDLRFDAMRYWNFHHAAAQGGGMLPQFGSHLIDLHLCLFGGLEPAGGYAPALVAERPTRPDLPGGPDGPMKAVEVEDSGVLAARLPGGGTAAISLSYVATALPDLRWAIHGDKGGLVYEGEEGWFGGRLYAASGWQGARREVGLPERIRHGGGDDVNAWMRDLVAELLLDFAQALGGPKAPRRFATLADGAAVWRVVEAWRAGHWAQP